MGTGLAAAAALAAAGSESPGVALASAQQQRALALVRVVGAIGVSTQALADRRIDFGVTDDLPAATSRSAPWSGS